MSNNELSFNLEREDERARSLVNAVPLAPFFLEAYAPNPPNPSANPNFSNTLTPTDNTVRAPQGLPSTGRPRDPNGANPPQSSAPQQNSANNPPALPTPNNNTPTSIAMQTLNYFMSLLLLAKPSEDPVTPTDDFSSSSPSSSSSSSSQSTSSATSVNSSNIRNWLVDAEGTSTRQQNTPRRTRDSSPETFNTPTSSASRKRPHNSGPSSSSSSSSISDSIDMAEVKRICSTLPNFLPSQEMLMQQIAFTKWMTEHQSFQEVMRKSDQELFEKARKDCADCPVHRHELFVGSNALFDIKRSTGELPQTVRTPAKWTDMRDMYFKRMQELKKPIPENLRSVNQQELEFMKLRLDVIAQQRWEIEKGYTVKETLAMARLRNN